MRLGRTVSELENSMSYEEFEYWKAFSVMEPISILREDALAANICKTIIDSQVKNETTLKDFTLWQRDSYVDEEPDIEQTMRNIKAVFGALTTKA